MTNEEIIRIKNVVSDLVGIVSDAILENEIQEQKKKEFIESTKDNKVISFTEYKKIFEKNDNKQE